MRTINNNNNPLFPESELYQFPLPTSVTSLSLTIVKDFGLYEEKAVGQTPSGQKYAELKRTDNDPLRLGTDSDIAIEKTANVANAKIGKKPQTQAPSKSLWEHLAKTGRKVDEAAFGFEKISGAVVDISAATTAAPKYVPDHVGDLTHGVLNIGSRISTVIAKVSMLAGAIGLQQGAAKVGSYLGLAISTVLLAMSLKRVFEIGKKSDAITEILSGDVDLPGHEQRSKKLDKMRENIFQLLNAYSSDDLQEEIAKKIQQLHDKHLEKTLGKNSLKYLLEAQALLYSFTEKKYQIEKSNLKTWEKSCDLFELEEKTLREVSDILLKAKVQLRVEKTKEALKIVGYTLLIAAGILSLVAPQIFLPFLVLFIVGTLIVTIGDQAFLDDKLTRYFEDDYKALFSKEGYDDILKERKEVDEKSQERMSAFFRELLEAGKIALDFHPRNNELHNIYTKLPQRVFTNSFT